MLIIKVIGCAGKGKTIRFTQLLSFLLTLLFLTINCPVAKSSPKQWQLRSLAFKRGKSLDNGVSFSWLEQTWNKAPLREGAIKDADFKLLKKLGFKSIRLPIAFAYFETGQISTAQLFMYIDKVVKQSHKYGFKLVLDLHNGDLNDTNYTAQTAKIINIWLKITKRYASTSPDDLLFELYNEPPPHESRCVERCRLQHGNSPA